MITRKRMKLCRNTDGWRWVGSYYQWNERGRKGAREDANTNKHYDKLVITELPVSY